MKWSWKLGELGGIGVYVHATFLILIVWIAMASWAQGGSVAAVVSGVAFILALFACIVLHEFGHAFAARRYGIRTRDITLLPIGGLARLERMPEEPRQELVVALAGPAVNLAIAGVLGGALAITGGWISGAEASLLEGPFFQRLVGVNLFIMVFNLLPAFPMDGGRALRAILATRMDYVAATQVAANIGQAMAYLFGLIGLLANPFLIFIALLVWIGAAAEASMVQMRSALGGIPVARAMLRDFQVLAPGDRLSRAVELTLRGSQKDFPVLRGETLTGMLSQEALFEALNQDGPDTPVASVLDEDIVVADSHEMLDAALVRLESASIRSAPVTHDGVLVGLLTLDNVGELLQIQAALEDGKSGTRKGRETRREGSSANR